MSSSRTSGVLEFKSRGFELYLPPTPFSSPPAYARFVMLDDSTQKFYDVDYQTELLGNTTPWTALALHQVRDPAIVFPPEQCDMLEIMKFATGFLVSIECRDREMFVAKKIGSVNVKLMEEKLMNWAALRSLKGDELPAEMRVGLLRRVWNKRPNAASQSIPYVTPRLTLDDMPKHWHRDGAALNYELDQIFAGGAPLGEQQHWKVHDVAFGQIEKSKKRAGNRVLSP
jgi:hypothetical protein